MHESLKHTLGEFSTALTFSLELISTYRVSGKKSYLSDCVKCTITANPVQWCTCWLTTIAWCIVKTVSRNCSSMVALPSFEAVDWDAAVMNIAPDEYFSILSHHFALSDVWLLEDSSYIIIHGSLMHLHNRLYLDWIVWRWMWLSEQQA